MFGLKLQILWLTHRKTMIAAIVIIVIAVAGAVCVLVQAQVRADQKQETRLPLSGDDPVETLGMEDDARYDPEIVDTLPEGFVSVAELEEEYGDILCFAFFESAICAVDLDNVCIWQTTIYDISSVVAYEDEIYIDGDAAAGIISRAKHTAEIKDRIYAIGEAVELNGKREKPVYLTVEEVVCTEDEETDCNIYTIRYAVENHPGGRYAPELFVGVETANAGYYDEFFAASTGTVSICIPSGEVPERLIVCGEGLGNQRTIQLE